MNIETVNPNILFLGCIGMIVLSGVGEYMHIIPNGTTGVLIGTVFGGSLAHVSFAIGNNTAVKNTQGGKNDTTTSTS